MTEVSHQEAFSELAAVALDSVSAEVADAVRAHASTCPECGPELAGMEATVATLGEMVPNARMSSGRGAGIRSRLLMRARSERESRSVPVHGPPDLARGVASLTGLGHKATPGAQKAVTGETRRVTPSTPMRQRIGFDRQPTRFNWYAIAATLAFFFTGAQLFRVTLDNSAMRSQLAAADTVVPKSDSMASVVNEKDAIIQAMAGPDVKVVALADKGTPQPLGRMFWNRATNDWMMVTYGLPAPKPGKIYQVWLVTDKEKISAGTFRPDSQGRTVMHANYALARDALRAVAITEEPDGGMPAPTGPMVVVGSA
ncbi:MAG: anti-sigma factor [Gemmatimonadaceae bacterium]